MEKGVILIGVSGVLRGRKFALYNGQMTIGRAPTNNIVIPPTDSTASRRHAIISLTANGVFIIDANSTNGTFVNGKRIKASLQYPLKQGDRIRIGSSIFQAEIGTSNERSGAVVKGTKIKLLEPIASGGMSQVYKAMFADTKQIVAVKFPKKEYMTDREVLSLFKKEINIGMHLKHPNVVSIIMEISFRNLPTMVMEYFPSVTLHKLYTTSGLSIRNKLYILSQVCDALSYVHSKGIIHNDIKPGNILVNNRMFTKITDFGTAGTASTLSTIKDQWKILGTLLYMSPEQVQGQGIDNRSDIYDLAIVTYELFTGVNPFYNKSANRPPQIMERQLKFMPPPPSINKSLPATFDSVVMKGLQKDPNKRFSNINDFKMALLSAF